MLQNFARLGRFWLLQHSANSSCFGRYSLYKHKIDTNVAFYNKQTNEPRENVTLSLHKGLLGDLYRAWCTKHGNVAGCTTKIWPTLYTDTSIQKTWHVSTKTHKLHSVQSMTDHKWTNSEEDNCWDQAYNNTDGWQKNEGNLNWLKSVVRNTRLNGNVNQLKKILKSLTFSIISAKLNEIGWWYFLPDDGSCGLRVLAAAADPSCAKAPPTECATHTFPYKHTTDNLSTT